MSMQKVSEAMTNLSNIAGSNNLRALASAAVLSATAACADGSIVRDPYGTWDPYARAQGINYLAGGSAIQGGGAIALRISGADSNGVVGTRNTSAIFLGNYYDPAQGGMRALCVTAEHNIADFYTVPNTTSSVRTGANYNSNPGQTLNVTQWVRGNGSASRDPNRPDFSFFWLDGTVAGNNAVLGTASGNLALVGYGRSGSESAGSILQDGNVRAVFAPLDNQISYGFNDYYFNEIFCNPSNNLPGLGRSQQNDSGAAVFNTSNGQLVGMNIAGTNGTGLSGVSIFMDFSRPEFLSQYNSLAQVPSPGTLALMGLAGLVAARRQR